MATLTYQQILISGTDIPYQAAAGGGDKVAPNEHGVIFVSNPGGSAITVTIAVPGNSKYGLPNPDVVITVPPTSVRAIGPLPADLADTDGLVHISYSAVSSVLVAAVTL